MRRLQDLASILLMDLGRMCCVDTARDRKTIASRIESEGQSFLTITLPSFGKDFDRSLDQGCVAHDQFTGFRWTGGLPSFLRGFLGLVFDAKSGTLLDEPSVEAIYAVRQFTLAFGKIFELPTPRRRRDAMRQFIQTEGEVRAHVQQFERHVRDYRVYSGHEHVSGGSLCGLYAATAGGWRTANLRAVDFPMDSARGLAVHGEGGGGLSHGPSVLSSRELLHLLAIQKACSVLLYNDALRPLDRAIRGTSWDQVIVPQHGPGKTADRLDGNQKFTVSEWPARLEAEVPYLGMLAPNWSYFDSTAYQDHVTHLPPERERPVRVVSVPKTAKTARIIAIEPTAMQFAQQGLMAPLVEALESSRLTGPLIGFTDQVPNQDMAREGSLTRELATLDLSEASDRVSTLHVVDLLSTWPALSRYAMACRSTKADVPDHGVQHLTKFASMGSALTFPIEAMLFLSIVVASIALASGSHLTRGFIQRLHGKVRVYGDDIIVPAEYAGSVITALESFGLKVNSGKSFWTGLFRESCGGDYYNGQDVTPVRVRSLLPLSRRDVEEVASLVSLRNQFYEAGLWTTAGWLDRMIEKFLPRFPIVEPTSKILGRRSVSFPFLANGTHGDRQVPMVYGPVYRAVIPINPIDDYPALVKWFLHKHRYPSGDPLSEDHLLRSGRSHAAHIYMGWASPY